MATISVSLPSDGETIDVSDYNTPITTIVNEINGNLDNNNISASAAIAGSKLATSGIGNTQISAGMIAQVVGTGFSAVATGTTLIPADDTIPQITEGIEFMTQAITPKSATNILIIDAFAFVSHSVTTEIIGALFQDATAGALSAASVYQVTGLGEVNLRVRYKMVAGTTSSTTFRLRVGGANAGTTTFNGSSTNRRFGAIDKSSITIMEYKA